MKLSKNLIKLATVALSATLIASCSSLSLDVPSFDGKFYVGPYPEPRYDGAIPPIGQDLVCLPYDDFKRFQDTYVNSCEVWRK